MRGVHIGEEATGGDADSIEREETSPDNELVHTNSLAAESSTVSQQATEVPA